MNTLYGIKFRTALIVFAALILQIVGCKQLSEKSDETEKLSKVNFHHVHLNVRDRDSTNMSGDYLGVEAVIGKMIQMQLFENCYRKKMANKR